MIAKLAKDYEQLPPRDQAGALRNVSTTKGINIDKAALMRGQPTEIVEHRQSTAELWAEFDAMFPGVVNGEAIEITDADVVPGTDSGADSALSAGPHEGAESAPEV